MEIIRKNELQEILDLVKMIPHGKIFDNRSRRKW